MAPTPQEHGNLPEMLTGAKGDRVVISGMAGLYPQAQHVKELENILYSKKNPVTDEDCRWSFNHPEVRHHTGKVPGLDTFDGQFFKVHYRLGNSMDAMGRKLLEQAYQAIYDAGVCPENLSGKNVGVYTGTCFSETEKTCFYVANTRSGFGIAGCNKSMFANRISYWLNAKGPSMSIDDACCSSIAALEQAYLAIARGECEAAIVGGANLCLHPQSSVHYGRIMTLCKDGKTKSFDQNADGCAKSEAVNVLFLQKAKDAKRIYAEVTLVKTAFTDILKTETGGPKYGFYRDPMNMAGFLKRFYEEANVPPQAVEYVEAFGSAVPEADKAELEAIEEVFCKNRSDPLLVGSVMSNIGYCEAASGISAITKVLLGYNKSEIAGNLQCNNPRRDIAALRDGRMQIVTDHKPFRGVYTAINGISVTGVNAHVLLNGRYKPKDLQRYKSTIPYLVTVSGRQESAVEKILDDLKSRPIDPEELALIHNIHQTRISGHLGRGYTILGTNDEGQTVSLSETANYFDDAKRPLWFVYSGMGSQWAGMGTKLMKIPIFAAAIERCRKVLEPKGMDIIHIITSSDKKIFDNILNSFVGIAAIQIGLTDILTALGIVPDKIIGHSVGELGCAYADGCFTAEEMILSAYSRGLVSVRTPFIKGSMAAVGIGYQQIVKLLPPEIEVACHNGPESSTISGPADKMKEFVAQLTAKDIFAKEVPCSNIAYHSRYIAEAGPGLLKYLSEVIKDPKPRSDRWVSTSVPENKWNEPEAKLSSAYYHTNNLLSSVLFEETCHLIPSNAVLVEIAPHGLLQAILKRSLPESCKHIPLTRRGHSDNAFMVLDAIGKLFMEGYNPKVQTLYPQVQFPVSTGTPMLSHLVEWVHHERWSVPLFVAAHRKMAAVCNFVISTHDKEHSYLQGHVLRGKTLYPFSAALVAAWDTLAMSLNLKRKEISVKFRDVQLFAQPVLHDAPPLRLSVSLHRANGLFEIMNEDRKVVSGFIHRDIHEVDRMFQQSFESHEMLELTSDDVYQMFYEKDHFYRDEFRVLHKVNKSLTEAEVQWNDNWVTLLEGMLQLNALRVRHDTVAVPARIRTIAINLKEHATKKIIKSDDKNCLTVQVLDLGNVVRCGGVIMVNIHFRKLPLMEENIVSLKTLKFVPRFQANIDSPSVLQVYLQIVAEDINKDTLNLLEIVNNKEELATFTEIRNILDDIPGITVNYDQIRRDKVLLIKETFLTEVDLVVVQDLSSDYNLCQMLYQVLSRDTFLINGEETSDNRDRPSALYRVLSAQKLNNTKLELIKWRPIQLNVATTVVTVRNRSELTLLAATRNDILQKYKLVILSSYPPLPGLKDFVKTWRKETDKNQIYLVMVSNKDNLDQLPELNLAYSAFINGVWGGEYYTSMVDRVTVGCGMALKSSRIGDLDSLYWVEAGEPVGSGIPVTVHYTAINDIDVKRASGVIPFREESETSFCMDFSGVTQNGQRVMGLVKNGAASSCIKASPRMLWPVPNHWTLEDAATVPSAYAHAFYILHIKLHIRSDYKILVHGATGALGQAITIIALAQGCEVFATVSDIYKKKFLMNMFPELPEDHIGNSRDKTFGDMIRTITKDKGCNIVISCLNAEFKATCLNSTAHWGAMVDTVQIPSQESYSFGMYYLNKERNYMTIDFSSIFLKENIEDLKQIQCLLSEGIIRGYVRPLSRTVYSPLEVPRGFRLFAGSRHRGRVLIRLQDRGATAEPRIKCSPELCQVIICDGKSFSLQIAERLIKRGAKKLLLHCINPSNNLQLKVLAWQSQDIEVRVFSEDLTNNKNIISLLSESNCLGPVEGIFVIATDANDKTTDKLSTVVANLDLAARKLCPSVRYFVVINAGLSVGQETCLLRVRGGLPATFLKLLALRNPENVNQSNNLLSWSAAVNAIESGLRSSQNSLLAYPSTMEKPKLLQQIAAVADMKISEDTMDNITLVDLGIEIAKVPAIYSFLRDTYHIALFEEKIPNMTIQRIRNLDEVIYGTKFKKVQGLGTFFSYVDPDELLATTEIVKLPTLMTNSIMGKDEFDINLTYLCVIPGLEGHHHRFQALCERLKLPALILQPGLDHLEETVRDTAERYAKIILKRIRLQRNFYILGYETGIMVALEVAGILEDHSLTGTVFCLGGTPEEIQEAVDEELSDITSEEALQGAVIRHMYFLMTGHIDGVEKALNSEYDWKLKIEACVRTLLGRVAHSAQYARSLIEAAYTRVKQARTYKGQLRELKSKVVLLRAASLKKDRLQATSLQKYSQQEVDVYELQQSLGHVTEDLLCSSIVNSYLSSDIIKMFEEHNICESYFLSADTFMINVKASGV